jgi:hypothetical protein
MQEFELHSLWLNPDDTIGKRFEDIVSASSSTDAIRKFEKYYPEKLVLGKLSTFYYTELSANAALILKQHRFVNLITIHVPEMEINSKSVIIPEDEREFEIIHVDPRDVEEDDEEAVEEGYLVELSDTIIDDNQDDSMRDIDPDECLHITLEDFIAAVKDNMFVDTDGHGYYANAKRRSTESIMPSDVENNSILEGWTHVAWYNK